MNYVPSGPGIYLAGNDAPPGVPKQGSQPPQRRVYFSCPRDTRVAGTKKGSMRRARGPGSRGGDGPLALWLAVADWPELGH